MTDNEIIKALEYCRHQGITSECERCKVKSGCRATLIENAFELINRQKAEIEQLTEENNALNGNTEKYILECEKRSREIAEDYEKEIKAEAIREFIEELKKRASMSFVAYSDGHEFITAYQFSPETIDNLVKEKTEQ